MILLFLACGAHDRPSTGLAGVAPATPLSIPEFSAVNQDGAPRSRDDLLGHPTVVWYFPAAGTPG